ncbi:AbiH family protein [Sphingobacterium sp. UGAL515B_05]|uniref:AbiH family protein n=1 Tax=Sphingobacterium sp. UGAL515B_05 TaxID=2986767 RepID=UPI0029536B01|nr:AbiH family protein [Sphingobacterium sp. UGAL515B_05]WON93894.1 bacteriophage abortive infection AbiH family protein [Sphingobacterium sp. UGAL515B_05]
MILTERRNKIFLIGNGFDLAHGLPTRYIDFIKWYLKECCLKAIEKTVYYDDCINIQFYKSPHFVSINSIPDMIEQIYQSGDILDFLNNPTYSKGLNDFKELTEGLMLKIEPKGDFCLNLFMGCQDADWSGIEYEINRIMLKEHHNLSEKRTEILINRKGSRLYGQSLARIRDLNKSIYLLKSMLIEYLKLHNTPSKYKADLILSHHNDWGASYTADGGFVYRGDNIMTYSYKDVERQVLFLNFNYTTYFESEIVKVFKDHLEDQFTQSETLYIHGHLNSDTDNIVFGVGDENKEIYSEIESLYDDDWLVPLKSFHYFRNEKYQQLLGFIANGDYEIYVIGHSCSTTDRTLLNMLFENDACKKIHVYHYSGINSYLTTAYNIARNFNDKVKLRKILQPFNPDLTTK